MYFNCASCDEEYIIAYATKEMLDLKKKIISCRKRKKYEKVQRFSQPNERS